MRIIEKLTGFSHAVWDTAPLKINDFLVEEYVGIRIFIQSAEFTFILGKPKNSVFAIDCYWRPNFVARGILRFFGLRWIAKS